MESRVRINTGLRLSGLENTNGLIRQFFPKGSDFKEAIPERLREVARKLNDRPRKTLGYKTPKEVLFESVAPTTTFGTLPECGCQRP
jgi:hypothetical protein